MIAAGCWTWDVDPVLLPIGGPFQIRWYGVFFLGMFISGYYLLQWQFRRGGRTREEGDGFVNWGIGGVLLGAWLGHRLFYEPALILENPLYLVDIRQGLAGLSSHGAGIGLMLACLIYARRRRIPVGEMFDRTSFSAAIATVLVRIGNLFNSEIIGRPTDVSWAVCLPRVDSPPIPRHPSQLYEALGGVVVLGMLLLADRLAGREGRPRWLLSAIFMIGYFGFRFVVEFFKEHQALPPDQTLTMGQWLSIPMVAIGVVMLVAALRWRLPASGLPAPAGGEPASDGEPTPDQKR